MNRVSRFAFVLLAATAFTVPALAVTPQGVESVKAPVAKPLSAWLVGPSQASAFDAKDHPEQNGCLMVTEFDNGMIVGLHAREAGIVGMTVDTKQQTRNPGDPASVGLNIGGDAYVVNAVATDNSTLALSLDEAGGGKTVAERLTGLGNFRLMIDQKPYYFATTGFTDGLARLQACMGSTMAVPIPVTGPGDTVGKITRDTPIETMTVTTSGNQTPLALAMPELIPTGYKFILEDVDPMTEISWQEGDDWVVAMRKALAPVGLKMTVKGNEIRITQRIGADDPVIEDAQIDDAATATEAVATADVPDGVWAGAKGESLASVLEAWGLMAGVNVKVDLTRDLKLPQNVKYEGSFNDAVQNLLAKFSGNDRPMTRYAGLNVEPVSQTKTTTKTEYISNPGKASEGRKFVPRPPSELKALQKEWAPMKQMSTIPDPPGAPKTVTPEGKTTGGKTQGKSKPTTVKTSGTWQALEGTTLRDALEHWGEDAGVKVVWLTSENYPLPKSVKEKGKFEDVVMKTLSQFEGQGARPVAQLNRDPKTGERVLIIKTDRS